MDYDKYEGMAEGKNISSMIGLNEDDCLARNQTHIYPLPCSKRLRFNCYRSRGSVLNRFDNEFFESSETLQKIVVNSSKIENAVMFISADGNVLNTGQIDSRACIGLVLHPFGYIQYWTKDFSLSEVIRDVYDYIFRRREAENFFTLDLDLNARVTIIIIKPSTAGMPLSWYPENVDQETFEFYKNMTEKHGILPVETLNILKHFTRNIQDANRNYNITRDSSFIGVLYDPKTKCAPDYAKMIVSNSFYIEYEFADSLIKVLTSPIANDMLTYQRPASKFYHLSIGQHV